MNLTIHSFTVGAIKSNAYILYNEDKKAIIIDPGAENQRLYAFLKERALQPVAIALTHGHYDHIGGLKECAETYPDIPVGLHPLDEAWAFSSSYNQFPPYYMLPEAPEKIERHYAEGQVWQDGGMEYEVIHTPGHSPGGVCFYFRQQKVLIAGDTLFAGGIGRTDLTGCDPDAMVDSLKKLMALPDSVLVYPGHGPKTTIGKERKENPFIRYLTS